MSSSYVIIKTENCFFLKGLPGDVGWICLLTNQLTMAGHPDVQIANAASVLGRDEGYTVKYNPLPERVPEGEA